MSNSSWEQERREMDERERGIVRRIAEELDAYAEGRAYTDGSESPDYIEDLLDLAPRKPARPIGKHFRRPAA